MRNRLIHALLAMLLTGGPAIALAGGVATSQPDEPAPSLPADPAVLKLLAELGDNTAAVLPGEAKLVGEFNELARKFNLHNRGPQARDFTIKMAWAAQRKRALFCGANHGVPHKLNDVWEYDLPAHAWVLLHPPTFNARPNQPGYEPGRVILRDGFLMTREGAPVRATHTWWGLVWEPKLRLMLWMARGANVGQFGVDGKLQPGSWLYAFDPQRRSWQFIKCPDFDSFNVPGDTMEYIPEWGGAFWYANRGKMHMFLLDPDTRTWIDLKPTPADGGEAPGIESVMAYDPIHKVIVAQSPERTDRQSGKVVSPRRTFHFDIATRTWTKTAQPAEGKPPVPDGHDRVSPMFYDPVGQVCLLFEGPTRTMWAYSVPDRAWTKLSPNGQPVPADAGRYTAYFDPARNVFVLCFGRKVWVYRYKNRPTPTTAPQ